MEVCLSSVCPSGWFLNANNQNACEQCPPDTHSAGINSNQCINCPSGTGSAGTAGQTSENSCGKKPLLPGTQCRVCDQST